MIQVFISYTQKDGGCANHIRQELEAKGYVSSGEPKSLPKESVLYPRAVENAILSSAAVVLVWSSSAVQSDWVKRHILFAQRLKKPIYPVMIDGTDLPNSLRVNLAITSRLPCIEVVTQLLPHLPPSESRDPLIVLSEKASHDYIRIRKEAIDQAAGMLKRDENREEVLALLEYLAHNDQIKGVCEKAQEVLDADAKKAMPSQPSLRPDGSGDIFGVKCKKCEHISYFDKYRVCSAQSRIERKFAQRAGKVLDVLTLKCENCGEEMTVHVDCEGYK